MFKDEAHWLVEWLEYHKMMGADHFFLYNNDGSDNFQEVLEPYIRRGEVDLIPWNTGEAPWIWPGTTSPSWSGYQITAFNDAVRRSLGQATWLMVMDVDEYIYPRDGVESFTKLLHNADPNIGSMSFLWQCFGTSFVNKIPHGKLLIETLVRRGPDYLRDNVYGKCIYRPEAVLMLHIHDGHLLEHYQHQVVDRSVVRLNHYITRDRAACMKKGRRPEGGRGMDWRYTERIYDVVFDDSMSQYVAPLRARMVACGALPAPRGPR